MYEVEAIVGKRVNHITKKTQYQVKWAYFSPEESTWMPEQNLKFVKNLIQKYNQSLEMKVANLVPAQKNKTIKKEQTKLYQIVVSEQQQNDFGRKIGIYEEQEYSQEKDTKKVVESNKNQLNASLTERNKKQVQYREGSRQSEKKSKIVQKVLNKKPEVLSQISEAPKKTVQKIPVKIKDNIPPMPPDYQNNRHKYRPVEQIFVQNSQKIKSTIINKQRNDNQSLKRNKNINFWQKHLNKIQEKEKQDKIVQKYGKNSSRVIPPPPPPRLLTPQPPIKQQLPTKPAEEKIQQKTMNKSSYQYRYDGALPLDNQSLQNQTHENLYKSDFLSKKQQKRPQFEVYSVLNMEKTPNGFIYLAQTNLGTKWLIRDEIVPQYSTVLVQFYEKHLSFQE